MPLFYNELIRDSSKAQGIVSVLYHEGTETLTLLYPVFFLLFLTYAENDVTLNVVIKLIDTLGVFAFKKG